MNFSSIIGIISAIAVFFTALITSTSSHDIFLNPHGILIVIGGTAAASIICFPLPTLFKLFKVFFQRIIGKNATQHQVVIAEIVDLARGAREDALYLQNRLPLIKTDFLKEAIDIMVQGGISEHALDIILKKRTMTHYKRYEEDAAIFKTIGKFPPAFGLLGTTLGMIGMLQNLGSPDSYKMLGPSMAVGLTATLYGIAITNFIFIPVGESLSKFNKEDEVVREMVVDGIKLLRKKEHPIVVEEHLKSFLLPGERKKLAKLAA
ncbi:MAG: MotA/TolQ/ExbB proton channel family protein [Oligoflexia bacterium]|nr:MotA/TolQ/ExbB proton channel family protein [Oligoflexia bacterium]